MIVGYRVTEARRKSLDEEFFVRDPKLYESLESALLNHLRGDAVMTRGSGKNKRDYLIFPPLDNGQPLLRLKIVTPIYQ